MEKKAQYLYIYFTKDDQDVLAWANMIRNNNLNLSTWIQAVLVAENSRAKLDIGAVCPPTQYPSKPPKPTNSSLFGDDSTGQNKAKSPGWNVRGENGMLIPGSILPIKVMRNSAQAVVNDMKRQHKRMGAYTKAVIRKNLELLPNGPDRIPRKTDALDTLALYDGRSRNGSDSFQRRDKKPGNEQKTRNQTTPDTNKNQRREEKKPQPKPNQESASKQSPQNKPPQHNKQEKRGNPLLAQIS